MIIAIDFDGTCVVHDYPRIGESIGAEPVLRELVADGHKLILWTVRSGDGLAAAMQWFLDHGIILWGINKNPDQRRWSTSPKAHAHLFIDDKGLGISLLEDGSVDWVAVRGLLVSGGILREKGGVEG